MASDDRRWWPIYQTKFLSSSSQIYSRKNAQNKEARKESVTEELYYVRNEGFLGNALLWWTKAVTAIPAI
jgi:hypothetical protein